MTACHTVPEEFRQTEDLLQLVEFQGAVQRSPLIWVISYSICPVIWDGFNVNIVPLYQA